MGLIKYMYYSLYSLLQMVANPQYEVV